MGDTTRDGKVHELYRTVSQDYEHTKSRLKDAVSVQKTTNEQLTHTIEDLKSENSHLRKKIKNAKQLINVHTARKKLNSKTTEIKPEARDSTMPEHVIDSVSVLSNVPNRTGNELSKLQNINVNIRMIVASRSPLDCVANVLKTFKLAFKGVIRCSVFLIDRILQAFTLDGSASQTRFCRAVPLPENRKTLYAVSLDPSEQCSPCFQNLESARKV
jgi:hypothetical protein